MWKTLNKWQIAGFVLGIVILVISIWLIDQNSELNRCIQKKTLLFSSPSYPNHSKDIIYVKFKDCLLPNETDELIEEFGLTVNTHSLIPGCHYDVFVNVPIDRQIEFICRLELDERVVESRPSLIGGSF